MEEKNRQLYEAYYQNDFQTAEKISRALIDELGSENSMIVQALAKYNLFRIQKKLGEKKNALRTFIEYLELCFQTRYQQGYMRIDEKIQVSTIDLQEIIASEYKHGAHDFLIWLDCSSPMSDWANTAKKTLITCFEDKNFPLTGKIALAFAANTLTISDFTPEFSDSTARLQLLKLPLTGNYTLSSFWKENRFSSFKWTGFRKTLILIVDNFDFTVKDFITLRFKEELHECSKQNLKIIPLICGNRSTEAEKAAAKELANLTGGSCFEAAELSELQQILPLILLGELNQFYKGPNPLVTPLLKKEAQIWQ